MANGHEHGQQHDGPGRCRRRWPRRRCSGVRGRSAARSDVGRGVAVAFGGRTRDATTCARLSDGLHHLLRLRRRRAVPADAAACAGRQVGVAAAPAAGGDEPDAAAGGADVRADRLLWKHLYKWAPYPTAEAAGEALARGGCTLEQEMVLNAKRRDAEPGARGPGDGYRSSRVLLVFMYLLNRWSCEQRRRPAGGHGGELRVVADEVREPLAGRESVIYVMVMTAGAIMLDQVAGHDLVLVDLGVAVPGGAGVRGAGAEHPDGDTALAVRADEDAAARDRAARPGQACCSRS